MSEAETERPARPSGSPPDQVRLAVQLVIAASVSAALCLLIWVAAPDHLQAPLDTVGYSTFHDFNHNPRFLAYRLAVWLFPLLTAAVFWALRRWWPGSPARPGTPKTTIPFSDHRATERRRPAGRWARIPALLPAALVIVVAVSSGAPVRAAHVTARGIVAGIVYLALVALLVALVARTSRSVRGSDTIPWAPATSVVNTMASALAVVVSLWYFTRHTDAISVSGSVDHWAWLPLWVFLVTAFVVAGWVVWRLSRGVRPERLERVTVAALVGSAAVWMLTAALPSSPGWLHGFDDMMRTTGADLWRRGYFPWRDFTFVHGFFDDSLRGAAGFGLFEHTLWGADAAARAMWTPLGWVGMYLLGVWAFPRRWPAQMCALALIAWAAHTYDFPLRWVAAAPVFILAGEAIRRRQSRWTALMTVALFIEAVLVPEASFQVIAIALVLVLSDVMHRPMGSSRWRSLHKTRDFVLTGLACSAVWAGYLEVNGALLPFIQYYLIFGPGHAASGSLPLGDFSTASSELAYSASVALVMVTIAVALVRAFRREAVSARQWLMLTCAIFAGLYGEKGLARADDAHLVQSIVMTIPLALLWAMTLLSVADDRWNERKALRGTWVRYPASAVALVALLVLVPSVAREAWHAPGNNKSVVADRSLPLVGYDRRGALVENLVEDLRKVVTTLSHDHGPVFDFTNSPGYFYYLLQQDSPTPYYHVSMTIPEFSQEMLVDQLRKRRPALVAFDSNTIGMPTWDDIRNEVRHYAISQYLLDGWTPVVQTHGVLLMARNDLVHQLPPLPKLSQVPQTRDLYFAAAACDWGYIPNFLTSKPTGTSTVLEVVPRRRAKFVDVSGWTYDLAAHRPARQILFAEGDEVLDTISQGEARPDVARAHGRQRLRTSGFRGSAMTNRRGSPVLYAVLADGAAHPLDPAGVGVPATLKLPGGRMVSTSPVPADGHVDSIRARRRLISTVEVPSSVDLQSFELATFSANGDIGRSRVTITSSLRDQPGQDSTVRFETLPSAGSSVSVRVGSCLQWHGYHKRRLYLLQSGGRPIDEIRLSDVS
jgi:hypothetical protein